MSCKHIKFEKAHHSDEGTYIIQKEYSMVVVWRDWKYCPICGEELKRDI